MPTLPLYETPAHPDAWHRVTAPGGYEWWYFDAEDAAADLRLVVILFQGFVFHPGYLRRYGAYRRRPTRAAPPVPAEYPCAYFVVYERGTILAQFMQQYAPGDFAASAERPDVRVGPNRLTSGGTAGGPLELIVSGTPWRLTWQGPKLLASQRLAAELRFTPAFPHAASERVFLSKALAGAEHHWVIANPLCEVSGTITLSGASGADGENGSARRDAGPRTIAFNGRGYHDHNYGTGPIGPGLHRWIWGRVLRDDRVETFHLAVPRDPALPAEFHLVEADAAGVREVTTAAAPTLAWDRRTPTLLDYPATIDLGRPWVLRNPRVVDGSPFYLRVAYETSHPGGGGGGGGGGTAFCEVAYPHRLRWPVLGRMIEMSIDRQEGTRGGRGEAAIAPS